MFQTLKIVDHNLEKPSLYVKSSLVSKCPYEDNTSPQSCTHPHYELVESDFVLSYPISRVSVCDGHVFYVVK